MTSAAAEAFPVSIVRPGLSPGEPRFPLRTAFELPTSARPPRRPQPLIASRPMHFRYYLMIAALFLIGLEAIYSLYQLVTLVL